MRKTIMLLAIILLCNTLQAQNLNLEQVTKIFNTWIQSKGKSISSTTAELKKVSPKWALTSTTPTEEEYVKSYIWKTPGQISAQYLSLDIEEDDESYKYSVSYTFFDKSNHQAMAELIKQRNPNGVVQNTNSSTNENSLMVKGEHFTTFLFSTPIKANSSNTVYRLDLATKYINKQ